MNHQGFFGWLRADRIGIKNFVSMPTTVQNFLELLRQFAEEGPQIIGGKVQLIYNQLEQVLADPAKQAGGFHEAELTLFSRQTAFCT